MTTERTRRPWLWRLAAAAVLALGVTVYLDRVFVPAQLKGRVEAGVEAALHCRASIGRIHYTPFRGVWMRDAVIYDSDGSTPLLLVPRLSLSVSWPALLRRGQVVISALRLHQPELRLRYRDAGGFNLPGLSSDAAAAPGSGPGLLRLEASGATVRLDVEGAGEFVASGLRARARAAEGGDFILEAAGLLGSGEAQAPFTAAGRLDPQGRLRAAARMDELPVAAAALLARLQPLPLSARRIGPVFASFRVADGRFRTSLQAEIAGLSARGSGYDFQGEAEVRSLITAPLSEEPTTHATRIRLRRARLDVAQPPLAADSIAGEIVLTQDGVSAPDLKLTLLGIPLRLRASLRGWSDPVYDIQAANEHVELAHLLRAAPPAAADLRVRGAGAFLMHLHGKAPALLASLHGGMVLNGDDELQGRWLAAPLQGLRGKVEFSADSARWDGVAFAYRGRACRTSGRVQGFREPQIEASLASDSPRARFGLVGRMKNGRFLISRLRGESPSTKLDLSGWAAAPAFDLSGKIETSWTDLNFLLAPDLLEPVRPAGLGGSFGLQGSVSGPLDSPVDWRSSLRFEAEHLSAWGLRAEHLAFGLEQGQRRLRLSAVSASAYVGTFSGAADLDFSGAQAVHDTTFSVRDLDLACLQDLPALRSKRLSGRLSADGRVRGPLGDLWDLSGEAELNLRNGRLLQFPLLGPLGDILFGKEHNNTVFSEAEGALRFARGVVSSDAVDLRSDQMALSLSGKADPRGPLDITVNTRINRRILLPSLDIKKYAARVVGNLGILVVVRITGTAEHPEYLVVPTPLNWLRQVTDFLTGGG
ncbi:MAG: AsmA-like C-terminal region-containing protein [Elusimicrobia bacterium]|nr:AsmA-like C-terminal region-containing protein [Elusimicrobiota bacterium]